MDLWPITIAARQSLLSTMKELDDDQWTTRSLCDGWTIRDVLAHLILAARPPLRRYVGAMMRARGNFDRANNALAATDAQQPIDKLLADLALAASGRGARLGHLTGSGVDELVRWLGLSTLDGDS